MLIVKIGGGAALDHEAIAADLARHQGPLLIVHGANHGRDRLAEALGKPRRTVTSVSGIESVFADEASLEIMMMAYAGLANKQLVACLRRHGINAIGLSGIDGGLVQGRRNAGIRVRENGKKLLLRDLSGKPEQINTDLLRLLLDAGYVPVLTMPILDEDGVPISSENDDVLALIQQQLGAESIVMLIEATGLMADPADPNSLVSRLSPGELTEWETRVGGRMRRKLMALGKLFTHNRPRVYIADGREIDPVSGALSGRGTCIC